MSQVATVARRSSDVVEQTGKLPSFGEQLKSKEGQFQAALPAHIPVERFMRVVMTAIQANPALARADRQSLWTSSIKAAQDGLLPDGREGALVIYNTKDGKDDKGKDIWIQKVQWMPMIAGIRKKVRNSGEIATWSAEVVHKLDHFEFELGDDPYIKHRPFMDGDPGPVIAAYSVAVLKSGEKSREVMTRAQLDKARAASKSKDKGPWVDWYEEMCRKTVARRHSKVLPVSTDLDDLIRRDDDLYDLQGARDEAQRLGGGKPLSLAGRLDALARPDIVPLDHEPDTGEPVADRDINEDTPPAAETAQASENGPIGEVAGSGTAAQGSQPAAGPAASPTSSEDTFRGDLPLDDHDPRDVARARGADAYRKGMSRKAVPGEYREKGRDAEARAWGEGHDAERAGAEVREG